MVLLVDVEAVAVMLLPLRLLLLLVEVVVGSANGGGSMAFLSEFLLDADARSSVVVLLLEASFKREVSERVRLRDLDMVGKVKKERRVQVPG